MAVVVGTAVQNISFTQTVSSGLINPYSIVPAIAAPGVPGASINYANGTAAGLVDLLYEKQFSLASTTTTLDLTSLTDAGGGAIVFARIRELIVYVYDASAAHLIKVYAGASNGITWVPPVANYLQVAGNGGSLRLSDPQTVGSSLGYYVDGTHKNLVFDSVANTVTFYVLIAGCSAQS